MFYHGTIHAFDQFTHEPAARNTPSGTNTLGVFLSACPRIAGHFTLKTEVIDAGYDSDAGSSTLRDDPWQFDAAPFLDGASLLHCKPCVSNPLHMDPVAWLAIVEELDDEALEDLRQGWIASGHDGVLIEAWDGSSEHPEHGRPCVEMHAQTLIVFDPTQVSIITREPVHAAWQPPRSRLRP